VTTISEIYLTHSLAQYGSKFQEQAHKEGKSMLSILADVMMIATRQNGGRYYDGLNHADRPHVEKSRRQSDRGWLRIAGLLL
jgi:hypothetical protein